MITYCARPTRAFSSFSQAHPRGAETPRSPTGSRVARATVTSLCTSLYCHTLRQIPRLIHIRPPQNRNVISQ
jgi:hypothetical protein